MASSVEEENHSTTPILVQGILPMFEEEMYVAAEDQRWLRQQRHLARAVEDRTQCVPSSMLLLLVALG